MGGVDCDADVVVFAEDEFRGLGGGGVDAGVEEGEVVESDGDGFEDEGQVGDFLGVVKGGFEGVAEGSEGGDGDLVGVEEVWD